MNIKYGILFAQITFDLTVEQTVVQFGYDDRKKAEKVRDLSLGSLDRMSEMLYIFEYPADRQEELEIDAPLPDFAVSDFDVSKRKAAASALGSIGGKSTSAAKQRAARANGKLGGRPRKHRAG